MREKYMIERVNDGDLKGWRVIQRFDKTPKHPYGEERTLSNTVHELPSDAFAEIPKTAGLAPLTFFIVEVIN